MVCLLVRILFDYAVVVFTDLYLFMYMFTPSPTQAHTHAQPHEHMQTNVHIHQYMKIHAHTHADTREHAQTRACTIIHEYTENKIDTKQIPANPFLCSYSVESVKSWSRWYSFGNHDDDLTKISRIIFARISGQNNLFLYK